MGMEVGKGGEVNGEGYDILSSVDIITAAFFIKTAVQL